MPREWIAELAGESAIVPTYRNGAAPFGGADCPSRTSDPGSGRTCGPRLRPHLQPQLRQLQIPRGLVTGPKSVQASVKTQVDLVLQLVQVFAV